MNNEFYIIHGILSAEMVKSFITLSEIQSILQALNVKIKIRIDH